MKDSLGKRMKNNYEIPARTTLPYRMPVIIRLDGKAFHTFTCKYIKPFDVYLHDTMAEVTRYLCENIQTCVFGYTQSDEISLLLHPYKKLDTQPWFGNNIQKITSISASYASTGFNLIHQYKKEPALRNPTINTCYWIPKSPEQNMKEDLQKLAQFDSRVFVLPEAEVNNYFLWRQQDATRNSVQMLAQSLFSHNDLQGAGSAKLQDMCFQQGHNWNDLETWKKRGTAVYKTYFHSLDKSEEPFKTLTIGNWTIDKEIPIFSQDKNFIEQHLKIEQE